MSKQKDFIIDAIRYLGYSDDVVTRQGMNARALQNNDAFQRSLATVKYSLMVKEDQLTADPTLSAEEANRTREFYSMMRLALDAVTNVLDEELRLAENKDYQE